MHEVLILGIKYSDGIWLSGGVWHRGGVWLGSGVGVRSAGDDVEGREEPISRKAKALA